MGAFDQDGTEVPEVVREYHRARHALIFGPENEPERFRDARLNLMSEVECRGGVWDVGRLRYRVDGEGLWVEQRPAADAGVNDGGGETTVHRP